MRFDKQNFLDLGSHTRKKAQVCHGQTPELYQICQPNHGLNQKLRDRAINCNVSDGM